jgi:peroxiredoxin Q/BCP
MKRTINLTLVLLGAIACKGSVDDSDTDIDTDTDTSGDTKTDTGDLIDSGDIASLFGTPPSSVVTLPEFTATNRDGTERGPNDLRDVRTIMWFFPAATTSGWTVEGCGYRDQYENFQALGVQIVGVSFDKPSKLQGWAEKEGFQYELWQDDDKSLAIHYGAADSESALWANRISVLLDKNGEVLLEYKKNVSTGTHPQQVLQDCEMLFGDP